MDKQHDITVEMLLDVYSELSTKMTGQRIRALNDHLREHELSLNQFFILNIVGRGGACLSSHLAKTLKLKAASITYLVDSLEKRGLVERLENPNDLRSHFVSITDQGLGISTYPFQHSLAAEFFANLSQDDIEILYVMMRIMNRKLNAQPATE
ncbi:MarR family transcriptional regulator [Paenibacillus sp. HJL G12]|uniref:MarR family transcriptional regulator n=1 Tax=Paenibacillus dendrobii TaxID=2691084 RepID=A0A7X3IL77_9BACL|nr:MarR family transcriptional regulator [Paenibacillus dendrobii]MWV45553.1 MarR family transcriptional regulator [Paenibacillus dendrobii]